MTLPERSGATEHRVGLARLAEPAFARLASALALSVLGSFAPGCSHRSSPSPPGSAIVSEGIGAPSATPIAAGSIAPPEVALASASAPAVSASVEPPAAPAEAPAVGPKNLTERSIDLAYGEGPLFFTPAFDGSQRFSLWLRVMQFARQEAKARSATAPHFTFFVNACYYSTTPGHSEIGRAHSNGEALVRRALTQEAINEGHDIGSHGVGHADGRNWSVDEWRAEFEKFDEIMTPSLFVPVRDDDGVPVFPRFTPLESAGAGEVGAACASDADCTSGTCAEITDRDKLCTAACNLKKPCPEGTFCGSPMFLTDTDVCLPKPSFPVEYQGQTLFFASGAPNFKHPALKPYRIEGYRAPFLASNDALYQMLVERGYEYDTSLASSPRPPYAVSPGAERHAIVEFPLMPHPGARTIPMDYNYRLLKVTPERMEHDYTSSLLSAVELHHIPWNVGHHFATWDEGAYLEVLLRTVRFTLDGCPDPTSHERACPGAEVVSFRDLLEVLKKRGGVPKEWRNIPPPKVPPPKMPLPKVPPPNVSLPKRSPPKPAK